MKTIINQQKGSQIYWSSIRLTFKSIFLGAVIFTGIQTTLFSQETQYTRPSWWFGVAGGANINYYQGSTQELNSGLIIPTAFHDGTGVGLFIAPLIEYHKPDTRLGFMLQAGYDNRKGTFDQVMTPAPCNCPNDLKANPTYLTIEPSIRLAPFKGDFYIYAGPRVGINLDKSFTYQQGIDPAYPDQALNLQVNEDFSNMHKNLLSMQVGAGYDIQLSKQTRQTQWALSPFVAFHPYFGQNPRSIESWNVSSLRVGAALKFGRGKKIAPAVVMPEPVVAVIVPEPTVKFTVVSPQNIPVERRVRETFPIRNYVFFDVDSDELSDRYVLLSKDQVKEFKEDRLEVFTPKRLSGRSDRQMTVYYNVLNILGDRMGKNPSTLVRLTGASLDGKDDGLKMAETVKNYLVDVFAIAPGRITTEGRIKPRIPSEQPGGTKELDLLREGDHRVSIWSESPEIMMQYQTGPDAPLATIEIINEPKAPKSSYVSFNVEGAEEAFTSWSLQIKNENGIVQNFGPYTKDSISILGNSILGTRISGDYMVKLTGKTKSGKTVIEETPVHVVLWKTSEREEGMRYSIIYEFNNSEAIAVYDKYLSEVVTPKIPKDGIVVLHGHTDVIGDEDHNKQLSLDRANDVKIILENALAKAGRTDVTFEVYGYGEDESFSPFNNNFPEERSYNRSVVIDIVPSNK
jgi:hypothetical protein